MDAIRGACNFEPEKELQISKVFNSELLIQEGDYGLYFSYAVSCEDDIIHVY